jgi:hypothetical protein
LIVRQCLAKQFHRGNPKPFQMEVKASNIAATHLHCREMSIARKSERRQTLSGCWLPVPVNDEKTFAI